MILLFDLDDTLIDSNKAYAEGMRQIGLSSDDPEYLQARAATKKLTPDFYPAARSRGIYFKQYLQSKGEYTATRHLEMVVTYERGVINSIQNQWKSLARHDLLLGLKSRVSHLAIVTNETLRMQVQKLNVMDPHAEIFDFIITSEEVGFEKPQPQIFQATFAHFNRPAQDFIMVGDSYKNDIEPVTKLGSSAIKTVEFHDDGNGASRFLTIRNLEELPHLLPALLK